MPRPCRPPAVVVALLLAAACDAATPARRQAAANAAQQAAVDAAPDSLGYLLAARPVAVRLRDGLGESSAAVASVAHPGLVFTINDSGNDPVLYALDTTGADRGAWLVQGATNRDWEAAALGPCAAAGDAGAPAPGLPRCVYVGDVGDNFRTRDWVALYRVPEPEPLDSARTGEVAAERLRLRYADGGDDVEAMMVGADGTTWLITKQPRPDASGRRRPALVYALPAAAWRTPDSIHVAALVDSLPIVPGTGIGRRITDAALSPDGRWAAVRTYLQLYLFAADPATGRIHTALPPSVCNLVNLDERQGEGLTWLDADRLLLTSEGRREPLRIVECPKPEG